MRTLASIFMASTLMAMPIAAVAQIPHTLSYQGILTDSAGTPRPDGSYSFTFRLYSVSSGGSPIWSETKTALVKRGLFSAILGSLAPIPDSVRFSQQCWLGVQIASDPELSPRMQLASVGSSISSVHADTAQNVPDNSVTSGKIAGGQVVKSVNHLHDDLTMRGANGASVTSNGDTITITASGGGGGLSALQNTDNALTITNPAGPTATVNLSNPFTINGSVGIGTTAPNHRLRVSGGPSWTTGGFGGALELDNGGAIGWRTNSAGNRFGLSHNQGGFYLFRTAGDPGTNGSPPLYDMIISDAGNVSFGGPVFANHRLRVAGGPAWTSNGWLGAMEFDNASAMAWRANAAGSRFGIGQSAGGLYFFNTASDPGTVGSPANYLMAITDNGNVGIGTTSPGGRLQVNGDNGYGVIAYSTNSIALYGRSNAYGVNGITDGSNAAGVFGTSTAANSRGVLATSSGSGSPGVQGNASGASAAGVFGFDDGPSGVGVQGSGGGSGNPGVLGQGSSGIGVWGSSDTWRGVYGHSNSNAGVLGVSESFDGVFGESHSNSSAGVSGHNTAGGFAGYFIGNVVVTGTLAKGAGSFKIDHPLDPENKYLYHSFVESPDMMDIYNGVVTLDGDGEAAIVLPDWFDALNKDFRYQLTAIGAPGPNLYVAQEVVENQFRIAGGAPGKKVSWQVTGIRRDAYAEKHRIPVEEMKNERERGHYLHPEAFGQPKEKGIEWLQYPGPATKQSEAHLPGLKESPDGSQQPSVPPVDSPKEK